jgi:hypothetical protein
MFYAKLNRNLHAMEAGLIFCRVVRCREINSEDVAELFVGWWDKEHACSYAIDVQGAIEIHSSI